MLFPNLLLSVAAKRKSVVFRFTDGPACQWLLVMGDGHVMWLPWLRGVGMWYGCAGWPRDLWEFSHCWNGDCKREEGVGLLDHPSPSPHHHIFPLIMTESVI